MNKISSIVYSLKAKIILIALGIILLLVLTSLVNYYLIRNLNYYSELSFRAENLSKNIKQVRIFERDFLLKSFWSQDLGQSGYVADFEKQFEETKKYIKAIDEQYSANDEDLQKKIILLQEGLDTYKSLFDEVLLLLKERGHSESGTTGKFEKAFLNLKSFATTTIPNPSIIEAINEIELIANNYINKREAQYKDEFVLKMNSLRNLLKESYVPDSTKINKNQLDKKDLIGLLEMLERFQKMFDNLVETDTAIGADTEQGRINELRKSIVKVEAIADELSVRMRQRSENASFWAIFLMILINLLLLICFVLIVWILVRMFAKPFAKLKEKVIKIGKGEIPEKMNIDFHDERDEMMAAFNSLIENLHNTKKFVTEVGKGHFETEVNVFNNQGDFGGALVEMRQELLKIAQEREKQELESQKRNWITQGVAHFNDVLRMNTDNLEELSYNIIKDLVDYLGAVQGVLFTINDDNKTDVHLELKAAFAFDRRKYIKKRVDIGEGLAGRCVQEKDSVYITDLPPDYFEITSGLGKTKPRCILITPLKYNEYVFGAIEITSMNLLDTHQIDFAKKISETVAASIANAKINMQTAKLLKESKMQAEELAEKEEEMRQNMEELQATQEEAARKEAEASGFVSSVNHSIIRADYDVEGHLMYANTKFLELMGYTSKEIQDVHISTFVGEKEWIIFQEEWNRVAAGGRHIEREMRYRTRHGHRWFLATYTPIKNLMGEVTRILYLAIDIHSQKTINLDYEGEINAIERSIIKAEFRIDGTLIAANDMFSGNLGFTRDEIMGRDIFSFLRPTDLTRFKKSWTRISNGMPYEGRICKLTKTNTESWFQGTFTSVRNIEGEITKITYIAYDITNQRLSEEENRKLLDKANVLTEELKVREEEMTKNIENLKHIQQEMARKDLIMTGQWDAISHTSALIEYDLDGTITKVNDIFCELIGYQSPELLGRNHRILVETDYRNTTEYRLFWENLKNGFYQEGIYKVVKHNNTILYLKGTFSPIFDNNERPTKILSLFFDITDTKLKEAELKGQFEAINKTNILLEYNTEGIILSANEIFGELFEYRSEEVMGKYHRIFVTSEERNSDEYKEFWLNLSNGFSQEGEFKRVAKDNKIVHLRSTFYPITDAEGKIYKILELSFDITATKEQANLLFEQKQQLEQQRTTMLRNMEDLEEAIRVGNQREQQLTEAKEELMASEEELRQNLEELQATQEEMERKQSEIAKAKERIEVNELTLKKALLKSKEKEADYKAIIEDLQKKLNEK